MDVAQIAYGASLVAVTALLIMYACNPLEQALEYIGRNLTAGAKGALLLAIASSLPEIMVSFVFIFSGQPELIFAGVFVTAGSACFNALVIPAVSILAARDGNGKKVSHFSIDRSVLWRDTFWLLTIEALFIYFFGMDFFTIGMAVTLIVAYFMYVVHVLYQSNNSEDDIEEYEFEALDHEETHPAISWIGKILDVNRNFFGNKEFTTSSAIVTASVSAIVVAVACHFLAEGTVALSDGLEIPVIIGAAIFAAAATSLPDTILSASAARDGDYEDAVSNAIGSNIFDVSFALGLPLIIALIGGGVLIGQSFPNGIEIGHGDGFLDTVRYFVWISSALACMALIVAARRVTYTTAYILLGLYGCWIIYVAYFVYQS